jgi:hypothetical protein
LDRPVLLSSLPNVRGSYWDSLWNNGKIDI